MNIEWNNTGLKPGDTVTLNRPQGPLLYRVASIGGGTLVLERADMPPQAPQPDWSQAPSWAQWWTVDANGQSNWFLIEPYCDDSEGACWCGQFSDEGEHDMGTFGKRYAIPAAWTGVN